MNLAEAARSAPARYAIVFAGSVALVMGVLLALIYGQMTQLLERHLEEAVNQHLTLLRDGLYQDGRSSLVGLVKQHAERQGGNPIHVLIKTRGGAILAGDLPDLDTREGWHDFAIHPEPNDIGRVATRFRAYGEWLDDATFVLVANDTRDLQQTRALLVRVFAIALGVTVVLALAGGLAIGGALLRRVSDVNRTARSIMEGDLSQRVPVVGSRDALEGLAESLNQMLARIEELMGNLRHVTSSVAHDLRSPLTRHRHRLEEAQTKPHTVAEYEALVDAAVDDTDEILRTFDAMLRIAQIEGATTRSHFESVSLSDVAEVVHDAFAAVAEDEGRHLLVQVSPNARIHGDRELLSQLLVNLVENALRHTPVGTTIEMVVEAFDDEVRLVVSDDGPGIPEGERERVLERFYRIDSSRSTPGNGLGLSFVAAVARLHGASIELGEARPGLRVTLVFSAGRRG